LTISILRTRERDIVQWYPYTGAGDSSTSLGSASTHKAKVVPLSHPPGAREAVITNQR